MSRELTEAQLKTRGNLLRQRDSVAKTIVQVAKANLGQFQPELVRLSYLDTTNGYYGGTR